MKKIFVFILLCAACTVAQAQDIMINRPAHDGSRFISTDFDKCGESIGTHLGDYFIEVGMAYSQSASGDKDWYILMSLTLADYDFQFAKDDRLLIKTEENKIIELAGMYNCDSDISETIIHAFGFRSPYFDYMYESRMNKYKSTQWFWISEKDIEDVCKGVTLLRLETGLNPCTIQKKAAEKFSDNIKYGYKRIKEAAAGPDFYDQFR